MLRDLHAAARKLGQQIQLLRAGTSGEIDAAFATFARERPDALFVVQDPFFGGRRVQLAQLAPATRSPRPTPIAIMLAGGLMSYGASIVDAYHQVGIYADRILKGTKPADLPVVQSAKFDLVINAETAGCGVWRAAAAARPRRRGHRVSG